MKLTFLDPLYAQPGPYACAYVDTSRDIDDPQKAIELRRRHLREELASQGADTDTMAALTAEVGTDEEVSGQHGQAIFASHGRLLLEEELPEPPVRDSAGYTALPDALPLAVQHAPDIPYAAVTVHRAEQEEPAEARTEVVVDIEVGRWPTSRVAPGPRHHRRDPAEDWPRRVPEIVGELEDLVNRTAAEVIVLVGDAWARGVLGNRLPTGLRDRMVTVAGDGQAAGTGRALLESELSGLFRNRMSAGDRARVETFLAQRARHKGTVEGMAATVAALQRGQASALLLNTPLRFPARLWAGAEPSQIALSRADLESFGVLSFEEGPAGAALVRALVQTGAELIVVPQEELALRDGVGVLLRYFDPGT